MHGRGTHTWADGRSYQGEYVNDKKDGYGVYTWADGRKYQGQWMDGKQHGKGKYVSKSQDVMWGIWDEGTRVRWIEPQNENEIFHCRMGSSTLLSTSALKQNPL